MLTRFARSVAYVAYAIVFMAFAIVRDLLGLATGATYKNSLVRFAVVGFADEFLRWVTGATHKEDFSRLQQLISEAEEGDVEAQNDLAKYYWFGDRLVPKDPVQAIKWRRRAAEQGHAEAQNLLGEMLRSAKGDLRDVREAANWFQKAAEQGHAEAQTNLGFSYLEGEGVPQSYTDAIEWYSRASDQEEAQAQFGLAKMYANGLGTPRDDARAYMWCEIALNCATLKDSDLPCPGYVPTVQDMLELRMQLDEINNARNLAQQWLEEHGVIETNSETLRQEQAAERERLTEAAEQGEAQAQYDLGINYLHGKGAKGDRAEAASWIRKSAEQGYAQAQFELGNMLTTGTIVRGDHVEAACWYCKAAEQGNMDGMHGLSRVYLVGQGVPKDYVQGHFWLSLAKANGDESSDIWLNKITRQMTDDQIAEAERLAREWLEAHGN